MILRPEPVAAALDALRRPDSTVDPARPRRRGLPPGARRRPRDAVAPHLRLPALRGRRRADPLAGRPRAVDRRLRADRRRAARAGRHRRRHPAAARAPSTTPRPSRSRSAAGLLEYPQYTRPPAFRGMDVPAILTSGDHGAVARWRRRRQARSSGPRPTTGPAGAADRRRTGDRRGSRRPVLYSAAGAPTATAPERPSRSHGCPD